MKTFDETIPVSDSDLEKGLSRAAEIIEKYGDQYWPLFDRLEREFEEREEKLKRLKRFKTRTKFL